MSGTRQLTADLGIRTCSCETAKKWICLSFLLQFQTHRTVAHSFFRFYCSYIQCVSKKLCHKPKTRVPFTFLVFYSNFMHAALWVCTNIFRLGWENRGEEKYQNIYNKSFKILCWLTQSMYTNAANNAYRNEVIFFKQLISIGIYK